MESINKFVREEKRTVERFKTSGKSNIVINNVNFSYQRNPKPSINNLTLSIPMGTKMALLGKSGAGKSTLLQLLVGEIYPVQVPLQLLVEVLKNSAKIYMMSSVY